MAEEFPGYETNQIIYHSTNSIIYNVFRHKDRKNLVLKTLSNSYPSSQEVARFQYEYQLTRKLDIPGVIQAYTIEKFGNKLGIVLEDFGGIDLSQIISTGISLDSFFPIAIKITEIIGEIHQRNIIHKDINPKNIVINAKTNEIKLIDFGISCELSRERQDIDVSNILEGSLPYISPEQTGRMNRDLDYRTDYYSLGATFYEMLTQKLPFQAKDTMGWVHCHIAQNPQNPKRVNVSLPQTLANIVLKLMNKNVEERYQSAYGIIHDLEKCKNQWERSKSIDLFALGQKDVSEKFQISQKLFGRDNELALIMQTFEKVMQKGTELMFVSGYAGIGKSVLINEMNKPIVEKRGYFIQGKFDQFQRDIPYIALSQAFKELIRQILGESHERLIQWKKSLKKALGPNGQIIVDIIPELEQIIGKQLSVSELSPLESQNRFLNTFGNFIQVFAQAQHPLVIFLDDMQWCDTSTLNLLENLTINQTIEFLFIIGAYRNHEVAESHPLWLTLDVIKKNKPIHEISLQPLDKHTVNHIVAHTFTCEESYSQPLTDIIYKKTEGNPFFIGELLKNLYQLKCINYQLKRGRWEWEIDKINDSDISDNVITFMINQIHQLPPPTQEILKLAACIGNRFDLKTLAIIAKKSPPDIANLLWETLKRGILLPLNDNYRLVESQTSYDNTELSDFSVSYKFQHDRIQQAAYALISDPQKKIIHQKIGRLLLQSTPNKDIEQLELNENLMDIVRHLNESHSLLKDPQERKELAHLNLIAGKKAKLSAAYNPAFHYLQTAIRLLDQDSWQSQYKITLRIYTEAIEVAYLCGDFTSVTNLADIAFQHARQTSDKFIIYEFISLSLFAQNKLLESIQMGLQAIKLLGFQLPEKPNQLSIVLKLIKIKILLKSKNIEDLKHLPDAADANALTIVRILDSIGHAAYQANPNLLAIVILQGLEVTIKSGFTHTSPFGFAAYGMILCGVFGSIEAGYRYGQLALFLKDRPLSKRVQAKTWFLVLFTIQHWKCPLRTTLQPLLDVNKQALENGDIEYAALSVFIYSVYSYYAGCPLEDLKKEVTTYLKVIQQYNQETTLYYQSIFCQTICNLNEMVLDPCSLEGEFYSEKKMIPIHEKVNDASAIYLLFMNKMIIFFLFGNYAKAIECSQRAVKYLKGGTGSYGVTLFHFYDSLSRLGFLFYCQDEKSCKRMITPYLKKVAANQKKLKKWAQHAPMNHQHKWDLVEAELAKLQGKEYKAITYYRKAITGAQKNEFLQEEALAHELLAKFYLDLNDESYARLHLQEANYLYHRWGATSKIAHFKEQYSHYFVHSDQNTLKTFGGRFSETTHSDAFSLHHQILDLSAVLKASQTLSGEMELENLLRKLMDVVQENAGAEKGVLMLPDESSDKLLVQAESLQNKELQLLQSQPTEENQNIPHTVVHYVERSKDCVVLSNASMQGKFTQDPYILSYLPKSILCMPILNQGRLVAVLYLENSMVANAFSPDRVDVLGVISSQAAISIENAFLYRNLEQRVNERTAQLEAIQKELVNSAHQAGMAEIATEVIHNIGNILTSIRISAEMSLELVNESQFPVLFKLSEMVEEHIDHIGDFITNDPKGQKIPELYVRLMKPIQEEHQKIQEEFKKIQEGVNLIQDVVDTQQEYAKTGLFLENLNLANIVNDALSLHESSYSRNSIEIIKDFHETPRVTVQKSKLIHILTNLLNNAKDALDGREADKRQITIEINQLDVPPPNVFIKITDNGQGIKEKHLTKIFNHGFTTKDDGHGFGLHTCANYMAEMGGKISVQSDGIGQGAAFLLFFQVPQTAERSYSIQ